MRPPALLVLLGVVAFVLLFACAIAPVTGAGEDFEPVKRDRYPRTGTGASSARVFGQILAETVLPAVAGGAIGSTYAHFGVSPLIMAFLGDKLWRSVDVGLDVRVLVFTAIISILTGIISGVLPALRLTRADVNQALKEGLGRTDSDSCIATALAAYWWCSGVVALSLVLLIGAGLMIRKFSAVPWCEPRVYDSRCSYGDRRSLAG